MPATPATDVAPPQAFAGCSLASSNGSANLRPENRQAKPLTFSCIVADPPWHYGAMPKGNPGWRKGGAAVIAVPMDYPTMSVAEIIALPVASLAERNAHLYLWTTNKYLPDAFLVMKAWGFGYRQTIVWDKGRCSPLGGAITPNRAEYLLYGRRGTLPLKSRWKGGSVIQATKGTQRGEHSKKPELFIDMVESVSPGPYLEMFARRNRLGWSTWGNQCFEHVSLHTGAVAPAADSQNNEAQRLRASNQRQLTETKLEEKYGYKKDE